MNKLTFILLLAFFSFCIIQETEAFVIKKRSRLPFSGKGTYYDVGRGSCGESDDDSEMVVAVNVNQMNNGANPNMNPHCNKMVKIVGTTSNEIIARIVDTCPTCQVDSLDLSPTGN
ncbi:hypothetical protein G6F26_013842 [Rhizopus arrhizus]|nr:hypothetical protein G6F26_013842 [Rhizopus arrhizus]